MKFKLNTLCATMLLAATICLQADEHAGAAPISPEFARMKTLVGTWRGTTDMGQGPVDLSVQYRLLAGGTILEERCFAGTPNEMVTMYFEKNGKLALTHYCLFGNRPGMFLKSADSATLKFDFDATCGIDVLKESHMHALTIHFDDADTITVSCQAFIDGKQMDEHPTTLKRAKS